MKGRLILIILSSILLIGLANAVLLDSYTKVHGTFTVVPSKPVPCNISNPFFDYDCIELDSLCNLIKEHASLGKILSEKDFFNNCKPRDFFQIIQQNNYTKNLYHENVTKPYLNNETTITEIVESNITNNIANPKVNFTNSTNSDLNESLIKNITANESDNSFTNLTSKSNNSIPNISNNSVIGNLTLNQSNSINETANHQTNKSVSDSEDITKEVSETQNVKSNKTKSNNSIANITNNPAIRNLTLNKSDFRNVENQTNKSIRNPKNVTETMNDNIKSNNTDINTRKIVKST